MIDPELSNPDYYAPNRIERIRAWWHEYHSILKDGRNDGGMD